MVVVVGETGSGKTTQLTQVIFSSFVSWRLIMICSLRFSRIDTINITADTFVSLTVFA